jgi:hypothetical protein
LQHYKFFFFFSPFVFLQVLLLSLPMSDPFQNLLSQINAVGTPRVAGSPVATADSSFVEVVEVQVAEPPRGTSSASSGRGGKLCAW